MRVPNLVLTPHSIFSCSARTATLHLHVLLWIEGLPKTLEDLLRSVAPSLQDSAEFGNEKSSEHHKSYTVLSEEGELNHLVLYMAQHCVTSNYLPQDKLRCPTCNGSVTRLPIPEELASPSCPLKKDTAEPLLFKCSVCGTSCTVTSIVRAWTDSVLGSNPVVPDDHVFATATQPDQVPVTVVHGIPDAAWTSRFSEQDQARAALRVNEFQAHAWAHTVSCFKRGRKSCRYCFPAPENEQPRIVITWSEQGATKPLSERTADDIEDVSFDLPRGAASPMTNRHCPAMVFSAAVNSDCCMVLSCIGIGFYITG
jgi:hypothetical protein